MSNITLQLCTAESVGSGTQLFMSLVQTLLAAQCAISPPEMWPKDYGEIVLEKGLQKYDFIIVGAGTAGSVIASRLSENPDWKVLLLEAGSDPPLESEIPGMSSSLFGSTLDWKFHSTTSKACKASLDELCKTPYGKMLGGSSSINSMIYVRGQKIDFDHWSELGNVGWDYESVLPYFKKSEGNQHAPFVQFDNGKYHSATGPLKVDFYGKNAMGSYKKIFLDAAEQAGHTIIDDINADKSLGYLEMQATCFNGRRQSAAKAFLMPAKNRTNLHVIKHAYVEKILINSNNDAYGVEFVYNETLKLTAFAEKEIILSASTFMSPVLLMVSGVGPKDVLEKFNISVKSDIPVGKNFIDHHGIFVWFKFNPTDESPFQNYDNLYNLVMHNSGELASRGVSTINGFVNPMNGTTPEFQVIFNYYTRNSTGLKGYVKGYKESIGQALLKENENHDIAAILLSQLQPKSRGYITLASSSPHDQPTIIPEYYSNELDVEAATKAIKQQISFTNTSAYQRNGGAFIHVPIEECDRFDFQSDEYFRCYIKYFGGGNYHPVGTCKMGPDSDADAVVNPRLKVRNIEKLRQADAGIFPSTLYGNTNAAVMMIGEKVSDFIKEDYGYIETTNNRR